MGSDAVERRGARGRMTFAVLWLALIVSISWSHKIQSSRQYKMGINLTQNASNLS